MDKKINLLVLDDEEHILVAMTRLLFQEEFGVATTTSVKEALEIMEKEPIKVVLSDHRMPEMTGVEFLKQVKDRWPDTVRILITGHADMTTAEAAINVSGVYRFIYKPWNTEELKGSLRQAILHYDLVTENRELFKSMKVKNEELEVLNRKLKSMYEIQKDFTSTVSHELRTPLASIKSTVDLVLGGDPGPLTDDQTRFLTLTKQGVDRLNRLINDILDLTKLESGKSSLQIGFNDLKTMIQETVNIQKQAAEAKGLYLKIGDFPDIEPIPFDTDKLYQVLSNLISNAIKFTETGGITISCSSVPEHNHVKVCVQDTGHGIKEEDLEKLFQKFQQLGDPQQQVSGTGLGLAICKEIIGRHGGKIWAESEEGKGACFIFLLPITERRKEGEK